VAATSAFPGAWPGNRFLEKVSLRHDEAGVLLAFMALRRAAVL
jgi:hypothetical protein